MISLAIGLYFRFRLYLQILAEACHRPDWLPEIKGLEVITQALVSRLNS